VAALVEKEAVLLRLQLTMIQSLTTTITAASTVSNIQH
jgi:hypothetical protein